MTAAMKQEEKKFSMVENGKRILEKNSEEMVRRYGEQKIVVRRGVGKLMKRVASRFVEVVICITCAISK